MWKAGTINNSVRNFKFSVLKHVFKVQFVNVSSEFADRLLKTAFVELGSKW